LPVKLKKKGTQGWTLTAGVDKMVPAGCVFRHDASQGGGYEEGDRELHVDRVILL